MKQVNLFETSPDSTKGEFFETLIQTKGFKLERIVSEGHATPPGSWYDQEWEEWVLLLQGSAGLVLEGETHIRILRPGDTLHLPSHRRHWVAWTDSNEKTIWLALHFPSGRNSNDEAGL